MTILSPLQPSQYPRRILLAVAAKSPQIVTETIYALAAENPRWLPTALHVITTGRGAQTIQADLSPEGKNWLAQLCADYQLPEITLPSSHIHIVTDANHQVLEDVRNSSDNLVAADFITQFVREFTADPHCRQFIRFLIGWAADDDLLYGLCHVPIWSPARPLNSCID